MKNSEKTSSKPKGQQPKSVKVVLVLLGFIILAVLATIIIDKIASKPSSNTSTNTTASNAAPALVNVTSRGFIPATISAKVGQRVVWTNKDSQAHKVASDPYPTDNTVPGFKSTKMATGDTYTYVFTSPGTYTYHDDLHPTVLGKVVVQ